MRASVAGQVPAAGNTVRPAEKGASTGDDHALMRRTVDAYVEVAGVRRKVAREEITAWCAGGVALSDIEAYLRATYRKDPTGVTAVRNADRGGRHAR